jgi:hypothetical protein
MIAHAADEDHHQRTSICPLGRRREFQVINVRMMKMQKIQFVSIVNVIQMKLMKVIDKT